MTLQLVRAWPPGYGGVERVAHELSMVNGWTIYSFGADNKTALGEGDPLPVAYRRIRLPALNRGRVTLPLPSPALAALLGSQETLIAHLPCPATLLLCLLARLIHPRRRLVVYWHAFLNRKGGLAALVTRLYEGLAIALAASCQQVITTSPALQQELLQAWQRHGWRPRQLLVLPCCIPESLETAALQLAPRRAAPSAPLRVLCIGRLDSYKRVDWLIAAVATAQRQLQPRGGAAQLRLDIVGDGPRRAAFAALAAQAGVPVHFWGRVSEADKLERLAQADLLVLPSESCNEAFGIVQLEAMAAGLPALAFAVPRSGMDWVGTLDELPWSRQPAQLASVLATLASDRQHCATLGQRARQRYRQLFARAVWAAAVPQIAG